MINGRRQPSCGGTSRMMREYQVRICERLGVKFPGPTRQIRRLPRRKIGGRSSCNRRPRGPLRPSAVSIDWGELADRIGVPEVTFHALRHTHASQLIASGIDIVTISKRLGHANPNVTLGIYAHMFTTDDSKCAAAINAALKG